MQAPLIIERIEEAQRLRGWIANGYAQVEFSLGDVIVRSLKMPEYGNLSLTLPHGSPDRIKRVRMILNCQGFFTEFATELCSIIDDFEQHHETRNLLAHGFCEFHHTDDGDCGLQFRKWHRVEGRQDAQLVRTFRISDLEAECQEIVRISQRALQLLFKLHDRLGLITQ